MTGWTKDASKAGRWKAPIPAGFNSSSIGGRMQMWRGDTRLTLARSPTLTYVHANSTFITFKGTDIASTYHDFANVHLVLYESWTASMHMLSHVDAANHKVTTAWQTTSLAWLRFQTDRRCVAGLPGLDLRFAVGEPGGGRAVLRRECAGAPRPGR